MKVRLSIKWREEGDHPALKARELLKLVCWKLELESSALSIPTQLKSLSIGHALIDVEVDDAQYSKLVWWYGDPATAPYKPGTLMHWTLLNQEPPKLFRVVPT